MATNHHAKSATANGRGAETPPSKARAGEARPAGKGSPLHGWWIAGLCAAGATVAITAALVGRSRRVAGPWKRTKERSFLGDAVRQVGLTVLAILARRVAERMPLELPQVHRSKPLVATD